MARTGTNENKEANQQMSAIQQDQIRRANEATDKYNRSIDALIAKGNPWQDESYLRNVNIGIAGATSASNKAAADQLEMAGRRTRTNTASLGYDKAAIARAAMRAAAETRAAQSADDYGKWVDYQKWLAGARLAPTGVNTDMFGSATSGRSAALGNLTQLGIASYGPVNSLINAAGQAGAAAIGKIPTNSGGGGCAIAAELFGGWTAPRTLLVRSYLNRVWAKTSPFAEIVMAFYRQFGRYAAWVVRHNPALRTLVRPVFERALMKATRNALLG